MYFSKVLCQRQVGGQVHFVHSFVRLKGSCSNPELHIPISYCLTFSKDGNCKFPLTDETFSRFLLVLTGNFLFRILRIKCSLFPVPFNLLINHEGEHC